MKKQLKAQVEFAAIFVVIVIAIVAIVVMSMDSATDRDRPFLVGEEQENKLIKDSVLNSIKSLARRELRDIYSTGGAAALPGSTFGYGVKEIGIWKDCDGTEMPQIDKIFGRGLEEGVRELFGPEMEFFGKNVYFDLEKLDVRTNIQENGVDIDVRLPTRLGNSTISQRYTLLLRSRLKGIMNIAGEITSDNGNFFESAVINTILHSNPQEKWLPTVDLLTGCGNTFLKKETEMTEILDNLIKYTVSHTVYDRDVLDLPENPFYVIGVSDSDLEVSFIYPDDWKLYNNMNADPDPVMFNPEPILSFSSSCIETMDIKYSMRFPVIVMVKDDILGQVFSFAVMANIDDNKPGCGFRKGTITSYHEKCVLESECAANIKVKDDKGMPVSGAFVTFGECVLGETDYLGSLSSVAPCMVGEISIQKGGYAGHSKLVKPADIRDYSVVLEGSGKEMTVHFYGVPMEHGEIVKEGVYKDYSVTAQPRPIDLFAEKYFVFVYIKPESGENIMLYNIDSGGFTGSSKAAMRTGFFDVFGAVLNNGTGGITVGYADDSSYLAVDGVDELYVYLPVLEGEDVLQSLKSSEIYKLKGAFSKCGIDVISLKEQNVNAPCG